MKLLSKSKVWAVANCDNCRELHCIYYNSVIGNKGGTINEDIYIWKDRGYVCEKKVRFQGFVVKREIWCGNKIGSKP